MGKLSTAIAAEVKPQGGLCTVPAFLASLPKEVRADLDEALRSVTPTAPIVRALKKLGHEIGMETLRRHRNGECKCDGRAR